MNNILEKNNKVFISGEIVSNAEFSHEVYGEGFYEMNVLVKRLSGQGDILPVTISERLIADKDLKVGVTINALGQFRSYNKLVDGKSKLMLTVFIRELVSRPIIKNPNSIVLVGYVCKPPVYRTTPFNREIADILIAVNRSYNKSDYIPCIAWGRNARFAKNIAVGEKVALSGRIQSREYQKRLEDDQVAILTAYEVSISKLCAFDNALDFDVDAEFRELGVNLDFESNKENPHLDNSFVE
jgi:single-stranded DNA-binding protein